MAGLGEGKCSRDDDFNDCSKEGLYRNGRGIVL